MPAGQAQVFAWVLQLFEMQSWLLVHLLLILHLLQT
jgi:hypothetical protein